MTDSTIPDPFITYRRADGDLIAGEFSFVIDPDFFDYMEIDVPTEIVKETWKLVSRETFTFRPYGWTDEDDNDPDITGIPRSD